MTPVITAAKLNIWTRNQDDEDSWELQLTTTNEDKAVATAERLGQGDVIATIYELGRFTVDGVETTDQVMYWWSENYSEELGGSPDGRGYGLPENGEDWVEYEPVTVTAVALRDGRSVVDRATPAKYRTINCSNCGRQLPQNEAHSITEEVETGRSSASYRVSASSSHRTGSHNSWSNSSHRGVSRSSGRHYYKQITKLLCEDCYNVKQEEEAQSEQEDEDFFRFLVKSVLIIVAIIVIVAIGLFLKFR